jgi:hypothetical protein
MYTFCACNRKKNLDALMALCENKEHKKGKIMPVTGREGP